MKNSLLLDEKPLIIMPKLAVTVGLSEAIFLQQLHYWLEKSSHKKEGHIWIYNTIREWHVQFPFWSERQIRRIIESLEKKQLIITGNFNKLPIDKTKWYRINHKKLNEISNKSSDSQKSQSYGQNVHMERTKCPDGLDKMSTPLPEITTESTTDIEVVVDKGASPESKTETAFSFFEKNGFGILTPHVGEKIGAWIDDTNEELVVHALMIAAENSVLRWNYAEGILRDWEKRKLTSVEQVRAEAERYKREGRGKREVNGNKDARSPDSANGSYNGVEF